MHDSSVTKESKVQECNSDKSVCSPTERERKRKREREGERERNETTVQPRSGRITTWRRTRSPRKTVK